MSEKQPKLLIEPEIQDWMEKLKKIYGPEKIKQFNEENEILQIYLKKIHYETQESRRLSMCKIEYPFKIGGTGIILKAKHKFIPTQDLIIKINRPKISGEDRIIIENEMNMLPLLDHSNIIRVIDVGTVTIDDDIVPLSFIVEPYIKDAVTLREYIDTLSLSEYENVDITTLDHALQRLIEILHQWVDALKYIHELGYVYLDIKLDNVIINKDGHLLVIDFGSAQEVDVADNNPIKIYFTAKYADPRIKIKMERSTSSNRVSSAVKRKDITFDLDYYALGKSILELLNLISQYHPHDFPQRPLYQSLHFLATRLLNGSNKEQKLTLDKLALSEIFGGLQISDYDTIKYTNLNDVLKDLEKEFGSWTPENNVPELETYPKHTLRVVQKINTVLTPRLRNLIEHPLFARLKMVNQLGLTALVYPTADHSRYDHALGTYSYTSSYIKSLFYDTHNCIFRNLIDEYDIKCALLASLIHDLGQYPLAHDLEEVHPKIFDHLSISVDLITNKTENSEGKTLLNIIQDEDKGWGVEPNRLKRILGAHSGQLRLFGIDVRDFKADMLSALFDGPIDADKADYIIRDSTNCRIPYGEQLDIERLLQVLTTVRIPSQLGTRHKVTIGVYEKGRASASAFSLARYLLYSSVYWHHTSRIIKSMLQYATALILPREVFDSSSSGKISEIREKLVDFIIKLQPPFKIKDFEIPLKITEYEKSSVKTEPPDDVLSSELEQVPKDDQKSITWYPGISITDWFMVNWIKNLNRDKADFRGPCLLNGLLERNLYKRVYTIPRKNENKELMIKLDNLDWPDKIKFCEELQKIILKTIESRKKDIETTPLTDIDEVTTICKNNLAIIVDIPNPYSLTEYDRPLIYVSELERKTYYDEKILPLKAENLTNALEFLYTSISPVRILCHPDLRQWIGACIRHDEMLTVVNGALNEALR